MARSVPFAASITTPSLANPPDAHGFGLSQWVNNLVVRKHANVACVALANKTARIAWAVVNGEKGYHPRRAAGVKTEAVQS